METSRQDAESLRRQRFATKVTDELDRLRSDPGAWSDYLADADATSVRDGLD